MNIKKNKYKHSTVSMPRDLIDAIKKKIEEGKLKGYRNHHQFCQEAVRMRYQQLITNSNESSEKIIKRFNEKIDEILSSK
jgi:hypothetical protein